jgi:hypothetical protein
VAAVVNGLLILTLPFTLGAVVTLFDFQSNAGTTVTARVSSTSEYVARWVVEIGTVLAFAAPFALVAAWRTWVHAAHTEAGRGSGWQGVVEAGMLGLIAVLVVLVPVNITRLPSALPYIAAYGTMATALGVGLGLGLRFTALLALRGHRRLQAHRR